MNCQKCKMPIEEGVKFCPNCGCEISKQQIPSIVDEKSTWLNVICFLVPLVGLIFYFVQKDERPNQSKSAAHCAFVGFVIGVVLNFILCIVGLMCFVAADLTANVYNEISNRPNVNCYSNETDNEENYDDNHDENYNSTVLTSQIVISNKDFKLPGNGADFFSLTSFAPVKASDYTAISPHESVYNVVCSNANGKNILINVRNDSDKFLDISECTITGIKIKDDDNLHPDGYIFPENISIGDTINIENLYFKLGAPAIEVTDGNSGITWNDTQNQISYTIIYDENFVVHGIELIVFS